MSFMQKEITQKQTWYVVDGDQGIEYFPFYDYSRTEAEQNYPGKIYSIQVTNGYGARMSAPGYLDCTDWCVFDSAQKANEYLEMNI